MGFLDSLRMFGQSIFSTRREKSVWTLQYFTLQLTYPTSSLNEIIEIMQTEELARERYATLASVTDEQLDTAIKKLQIALKQPLEVRIKNALFMMECNKRGINTALLSDKEFLELMHQMERDGTI